MPKSAQFIISWSPDQKNYLLIEAENGPQHFSPENSDAWLAWLEEHHAFAFHGRNGQLNLLKEQRNKSGIAYWYAYHRCDGRMLKRYLGLSTRVRLDYLEEIAASLTHPDATKSFPSVPQRNEKTIQQKTDRRNPSRRTTDHKKKTGVIQPSTSTPHAQNKVPAPPLQFEPLLLTKLQLPRPQQSLLPRLHLLKLLDKGLEKKITLIAGPAGYGKTTLVSQWITEQSTHENFPRVACLTLDQSDNDPIRFWRSLIAACQQLHPESGKEALELLRAHLLPPFKPLEMMLTALLNTLSQLEHPGILILDNLHEISSSQVRASLTFFLEHLPTSLHLVLLVRGDPPFSLARLRAQNELLDIYPPHLAFSFEETRLFFEQELPFTLSIKVLRQIAARLEGWPAGMRLLARPLHPFKNEQDIESMLTSLVSNFWSVQEYFLNEVLHTLPQEQQKFLLQTCFLPRITASLCDTVTDREDSVHLLEVLRSNDLFLIPLDATGEWTRYHSLFAEAMQQEALRQLGEEDLCHLIARASTWYEAHGLLTEAIETALNADLFTRSASLIVQFIANKRSTPTIPEWYSLRRWLEQLPDKELERHPELCIHYAMALLFLQMEGPHLVDKSERIYALLQIAEQKWRDTNTITKLAEVFAFRALLARQEGYLLQAVTWARQSLTWLPPEDATWRNLSLTVVGEGELLDGNLDDAQRFFLEALALSEQQGNLIYARATRGMLSGVSFERGALHLANIQARQMQAEARAQEDYDDVAHTQLVLARIAYQWNHLAEAEQATQEALSIGEQMYVEEFLGNATIFLSLIEQARGETVSAQQRIIAWLVHNQTSLSPYRYQLYREVEATLARIQLASGNLAAAERWFASLEQREETLPLLQRQREQLLHAHLLILQGNLSPALERLENFYASACQTGHVYFRLEVQLLLCLAYTRQGAHEKARFTSSRS